MIARGPGAPIEEIPPVARVVIYAADGGYYLLRYDATDAIVADTWRQSLAEAKDQSRYEYLTADDDWTIEGIALESVNPGGTPTDPPASGF